MLSCEKNCPIPARTSNLSFSGYLGDLRLTVSLHSWWITWLSTPHISLPTKSILQCESEGKASSLAITLSWQGHHQSKTYHISRLWYTSDVCIWPLTRTQSLNKQVLHWSDTTRLFWFCFFSVPTWTWILPNTNPLSHSVCWTAVIFRASIPFVPTKTGFYCVPYSGKWCEFMSVSTRAFHYLATNF